MLRIYPCLHRNVGLRTCANQGNLVISNQAFPVDINLLGHKLAAEEGTFSEPMKAEVVCGINPFLLQKLAQGVSTVFHNAAQLIVHNPSKGCGFHIINVSGETGLQRQQNDHSERLPRVVRRHNSLEDGQAK